MERSVHEPSNWNRLNRFAAGNSQSSKVTPRSPGVFSAVSPQIRTRARSGPTRARTTPEDQLELPSTTDWPVAKSHFTIRRSESKLVKSEYSDCFIITL